MCAWAPISGLFSCLLWSIRRPEMHLHIFKRKHKSKRQFECNDLILHWYFGAYFVIFIYYSCDFVALFLLLLFFFTFFLFRNNNNDDKTEKKNLNKNTSKHITKKNSKTSNKWKDNKTKTKKNWNEKDTNSTRKSQATQNDE